MLKRKILRDLENWKLRKNQECLLVKGARQVGKTTIIRKFAQDAYSSFQMLDFEADPGLREIFEGTLEVDAVLQKVSLKRPGFRVEPGKTLLFLDEIQACPNARTALKYLAADSRFDVIASGSLLGINYRDVSSFPVGYERQMEMNAMDFEEFLWALGIGEEDISKLRGDFLQVKKQEEAVHSAMMEHLRTYLVVGGMPAVVNRYLSTNNFGEVHREQQKILDGYFADISKYAAVPEKPKIRDCFLSLPRQLAQESKKFRYAEVGTGGTAKKYANSLEWLRDAGMVRFCRNVSVPTFPLKGYERENQFKIYGSDIGLLVALFGFQMKDALFHDTLKGPAKGGIYENLVADMLSKNGHPLHYFKREDSTREIEFLLERDAGILPVEVKARNGATPSLDGLLEDNPDIPTAYKLISGNAGKSDRKISLPLYMGMFL